MIAAAACLLLTGCGRSVREMSSLPALSRPYLGEYKCERLLLAGEDALAAFDGVRLTLGADGTATLAWRTREGGEGSILLNYRADPDAQEIAFFPPGGAARTFPMKKGTVCLGEIVGGRYLYASFCR